MPSRDRMPVVALLVLAGLFCVINLSVVASRSMLPLQIDDLVMDKRVFHEKHVGVDDVSLLYLELGRVLHVDRAVFLKIEIGDEIAKKRWSRDVSINGVMWTVPVSNDLRGMLVCMPIAVLVCTGLALIAVRSDVGSASVGEPGTK